MTKNFLKCKKHFFPTIIFRNRNWSIVIQGLSRLTSTLFETGYLWGMELLS